MHFVRRLDGPRVILPNDPFEMFVDGETIVLRKYEPACIFCGHHTAHLTTFRGKHICQDCLNRLPIQVD